MTDAAKDTLYGILEKWGFPTLVSVWLAHFVLMPMVEEQRLTLKEVRETQREMGETQREIANAITEQTRLLYAIQPKVAGTAKPESNQN